MLITYPNHCSVLQFILQAMYINLKKKKHDIKLQTPPRLEVGVSEYLIPYEIGDTIR